MWTTRTSQFSFLNEKWVLNYQNQDLSLQLASKFPNLRSSTRKLCFKSLNLRFSPENLAPNLQNYDFFNEKWSYNFEKSSFFMKIGFKFSKLRFFMKLSSRTVPLIAPSVALKLSHRNFIARKISFTIIKSFHYPPATHNTMNPPLT